MVTWAVQECQPDSKLGNYLLNPTKEHNKARYFKSLGYASKNVSTLRKDMTTQLKTSPAVRYEKDEYGNTVYNVFMKLGINKTDLVKTVWITRKGDKYPSFVTAFKASKLERDKYEK